MRAVLLVGAGAVVGASVGLLVVRRAQVAPRTQAAPGARTARAGQHQRSTSLPQRLRDVTAVVREAMAERESELRVALGVDTGALDDQAAQELLENPASARR